MILPYPNGSSSIADITDEVENRYEKLRKVPEVNAYLEAELDVCRMLQQVQEQFRNGIDLNIPNV